MPVIHQEISISAPPERVFDLARNIDLHQATMTGTGEKAVAGVVTGLIGAGEEVTWEATHFGVRQRLSSKITQFDRPKYFQDHMLRGAFAHLTHDHLFTAVAGGTMMVDRLEYGAPLGGLGWLAEKWFLTGYLHRLLKKRNAILKRIAETEEWRKYLGKA